VADNFFHARYAGEAAPFNQCNWEIRMRGNALLHAIGETVRSTAVDASTSTRRVHNKSCKLPAFDATLA
jgi:hypothetical protein